MARRVADAATSLARHYRGAITVSVVDGGGHLVLLQRMDGATIGSIRAAIGKARSAVHFARPTSALERGGWVFGTVQGLCAVAGGVPVVLDGRMIGGVGVSGLTPAQDEEVAKGACNLEVLKGAINRVDAEPAPEP